MSGKYLVDENGTILEEVDDIYRYAKLEPGDRIIRNGTIQYLSESIDLKYHFIKINPNIYYKYAKKYSILDTLACHIGYMDNICMFRNGKLITLKNIDSLCDVSKSTVKRQINRMIKEDLLHKIKDGKKTYFMINPWLCHRGRRISMKTYNEFKESQLRYETEKCN